MKTSIVTGVSGQDGSWLAELLLDKGYKVYGIKRRTSTDNLWRIKHLLNNSNLEIIEGELTDACSMNNIVSLIKPDELYNLAAMSHVHSSFEQPAYTFDVNARGVVYLLESIRSNSRYTKFYQASTSEVWGSNYTEKDGEKYQDENTSFSANSPYALSKIAAHHAVDLYRKAYGMFACAGILHNHEGSRRGEEFVTRKITKWIGEYINWRNKTTIQGVDVNQFCLDDPKYIWCLCDKFPKLRLGNLDTYRDWSDARDMVCGMWMIMQQYEPKDFVLGSGKARTVREFCKQAFSIINISDWEKYIYIDPKFFRPCDVEFLQAKPTKANKELGWKPKISFEKMIEEMVSEDIKRAKSG